MPKFSTLWTAAGAISIVLGFLSLLQPTAAGVTTLTLSAVGLGLAGLLQAVAAFEDETSWKDRVAPLLLAAAVMALAVLVFQRPAVGAKLVVGTLAALFMLSGVAKIAWAWLRRSEGFLWPALLSGLLSILLAILIMVDLQERALRLLGLLVGIELMLNGMVLLAAASSARRIRQYVKEQNHAAPV